MQDEKSRKCITLAAFEDSFFDTLQYSLKFRKAFIFMI